MKKLFNMNKTLVIVLLLVLVCFLVCGYLSSKAELSHFKNQVTKLDFETQKFKETISENGCRIVEQEQLILSQKDALDLKILEVEKLKKVQSQVIVKTITQIDSVFIPFLETDTIVLNQSDTINTYLKVPMDFSILNEFYKIKGVVNTKGINLDSLSFTNKMNITIGSKSQGVFKKPKPIVLITNENPYVNTISMQNVVIKNEIKWYNKKGLWFGVGVALGVAIPVIIK
jgi:hypothetical protein